jgi:hypothetical protein
MRRGMAASAALVLVVGVVPLVSSVGAGAAMAADGAAVPCDFDGDGFADLAVGVPGEDVRGRSDAGAVQVLYGSASGVTVRDQLWHQGRKGVKGALERGDHFASTVACGYFDADRYADLAIGIPSEDIGRKRDAGAVQVLYGGPRGLTARDQLWHQGKSGVPGANESGDLFGGVLAAGDLDGDGFDDLAIGVPGEDVGSVGPEAGAVVVLRGSGSGLTSAGAVKIRQGLNGLPSQPSGRERFGDDLATGDVNGDGRADLVVIVHFEADTLGPSDEEVDDAVPAVHVIPGSPAGPDPGNSQFFGLGALGFEGKWYVAGRALDDLNEDGLDDLALTAFERGTGTRTIAVLHGHSDGLHPAALSPVGTVGVDGVWASPFPSPEDVGWADARYPATLVAGDVTGDGHTDLVLGATRLNGRAIEAVAVAPGTGSGLATSFVEWQIGIPDLFASALPDPGLMQVLPLSGGAHEWLVVGWPAATIGSARAAGAVGVLQGTAAGTRGPVTVWHQDSPGIKGGAETGDELGGDYWR